MIITNTYVELVEKFNEALEKLAELEDEAEMMTDREVKDLTAMLTPIMRRYKDKGYEFIDSLFGLN